MKLSDAAMANCLHLIGTAAWVGLWCLRDGVPLVPMLFRQFEDGHGDHSRYADGEPDDALREATAQFEQPPPCCVCAVLVQSGDSGSTGIMGDSVLLTVRWYGPDIAQMTLALSGAAPAAPDAADARLDAWDTAGPLLPVPQVLAVVGRLPLHAGFVPPAIHRTMQLQCRATLPGEAAPGRYFDVVLPITTLEGREVVRWRGVEMALGGGNLVDQTVMDEGQEAERTPVVWSDQAVPYTQFVNLVLHFADGSALLLYAHLDDGSGYHGFYLEQRIPPEWDDDASRKLWSIFRPRELGDWPLGRIHVTEVREDTPTAQVEATLLIGPHRVRLRAAEVFEERDGSYRIADADESILVQIDGRRP